MVEKEINSRTGKPDGQQTSHLRAFDVIKTLGHHSESDAESHVKWQATKSHVCKHDSISGGKLYLEKKTVLGTTLNVARST